MRIRGGKIMIRVNLDVSRVVVMDIRNTRAIKSLRVNGNVMFSGDIVPVIKGRIGVIDRLRINECVMCRNRVRNRRIVMYDLKTTSQSNIKMD